MADPTGLKLATPPQRISTRVLWVGGLFVCLLIGGIIWGYRHQQSENQIQTIQLETQPRGETKRADNFTEELGGKNQTSLPTNATVNPTPSTSPWMNGTTPPLPSSFPKADTIPVSNPTTPVFLSNGMNSYRSVAWQREEQAMKTVPADVFETPKTTANPVINNPLPTGLVSKLESSFESSKGQTTLKRLPPEGEYLIPAGSWIPAQLGQGVVSDLAGDVEAIITENLSMVKNGQKIILIPQRSLLIGTYSSRLAVGQNRLLQVWTKILLPDHSYINLTDFGSSDPDGSAGLTGKVNAHTWRLLRDAAITTAFAVGVTFTQQRQSSLLTAPTFGDSASQAVGQQLAQIGGTQFANNFQRQPTITLTPGKEFQAFVNRTILLDGPYTPMTDVLPKGVR